MTKNRKEALFLLLFVIGLLVINWKLSYPTALATNQVEFPPPKEESHWYNPFSWF